MICIRVVTFIGSGSRTHYTRRWGYSYLPSSDAHVLLGRLCTLELGIIVFSYWLRIPGLWDTFLYLGWRIYECSMYVFYISLTSLWLTLWQLIPALLNIIETLINITYLYLAHIAQWPAAPMIGFGAALMTLSKTLLYLAQEYYCGFCAVGHNKVWDLVLLWIVPNGCIAFLLQIVCTFANVTL
jgi:hypothetical protein